MYDYRIMTTDELTRVAYTQASTPLEHALVRVLEDWDVYAAGLQNDLTDAQNATEEAEKECSGLKDQLAEAEGKLDTADLRLDEAAEAVDALRALCDACLAKLEAVGTAGDLCEQLRQAARDFPTTAEQQAEATRQRQERDARILAFDKRAPGFAALYGQRGQLEHRGPRGRSWTPLLAGKVDVLWLSRRLPPTGHLRVVAA